MTDGISKAELNKMLFSNLVIMLSTTAMQQMGKVVSPITGKTEIELPGAQATIDMIDMLRDKSEGNRDEEEDRLVTQTLSALQMNYVETAKQTPPAEEPASSDAPEPPAHAANSETETGSKDEAETGPKDESKAKDPKFHKSYGES